MTALRQPSPTPSELADREAIRKIERNRQERKAREERRKKEEEERRRREAERVRAEEEAKRKNGKRKAEGEVEVEAGKKSKKTRMAPLFLQSDRSTAPEAGPSRKEQEFVVEYEEMEPPCRKCQDLRQICEVEVGGHKISCRHCIGKKVKCARQSSSDNKELEKLLQELIKVTRQGFEEVNRG